VAAPRRIAGERRVNVTIGKDEVAAIKKWQDLTVAAVSEVRGMEKGVGRRCEEAVLLATLCCRLHQRRRVPFRQVHPIAADLEPALEKVKLGALAGPIDPLDDDQRPWIGAFARRLLALWGGNGVELLVGPHGKPARC